jgi:lipopolysaccharide export system protein LptA
MKFAGLILLLCCAASAAWAADAPKASLLGSHDTRQPINIEADKMQADLNAKTVIYTGNVIVTQGDIRMRANSMKADNKANKIFADGKVVVDSPTSGTATGDSAVYDVTPHTVTLTGHVVLVHGKDVLRQSHLTYNLATGIVQAVTPGGRVQGVFTPTPPASPPGN